MSVFVRDNFNWPRQHPAFVIIANEIAEIVRNGPARSGQRVGLPRLAYNFAALIYKDIRDSIGPRRDNLLFSFLSRRLRTNARQYAAKLASAVEAR